jgi:hypothetical protein
MIVSNWLAWRCPTRSVLAPFFARYAEHASGLLALGPGSARLAALSPAHDALSKLKHLALLDAEPAALSVLAARVRSAPGYKGPQPELLNQTPLVPLPASVRGRFDAVAAFHVLQALPGTFPTKASALAAGVLPALAPGPDSALFGATVLGAGVSHNPLGSVLLWLGYHVAAMHNVNDTSDALRAGLAPYFDEVEVEVVGAVALFVCRGPRSQHLT